MPVNPIFFRVDKPEPKILLTISSSILTMLSGVSPESVLSKIAASAFVEIPCGFSTEK